MWMPIYTMISDIDVHDIWQIHKRFLNIFF